MSSKKYEEAAIIKMQLAGYIRESIGMKIPTISLENDEDDDRIVSKTDAERTFERNRHLIVVYENIIDAYARRHAIHPHPLVDLTVPNVFTGIRIILNFDLLSAAKECGFERERGCKWADVKKGTVEESLCSVAYKNKREIRATQTIENVDFDTKYYGKIMGDTFYILTKGSRGKGRDCTTIKYDDLMKRIQELGIIDYFGEHGLDEASGVFMPILRDITPKPTGKDQKANDEYKAVRNITNPEFKITKQMVLSSLGECKAKKDEKAKCEPLEKKVEELSDGDLRLRFIYYLSKSFASKIRVCRIVEEWMRLNRIILK